MRWEPFMQKASVSCVVWFASAWKDFTSGRRTGNSVMEILSMHQETRGQFPKEITKSQGSDGGGFTFLSAESLIKIILLPRHRNKFCHASMQLCTWEVRGLRRHEDGGTGLLHWLNSMGMLRRPLSCCGGDPKGVPSPTSLLTHMDFWPEELKSQHKPSRYCPQKCSCLYQTEVSHCFCFLCQAHLESFDLASGRKVPHPQPLKPREWDEPTAPDPQNVSSLP